MEFHVPLISLLQLLSSFKSDDKSKTNLNLMMVHGSKLATFVPQTCFLLVKKKKLLCFDRFMSSRRMFSLSLSLFFPIN